MKLKKNFVAATMLAGATTIMSFMSAGTAQAQGALVMYCGVQEEWCRAMTTAFERETGIKVAMTRKSSGEIYAQVKAESRQSARRHLVGRHRRSAHAGRRGRPDGRIYVAEEQRTQRLGDRQWEQSKKRTIGIYSGALGFGYNTELLKSKGVAGAEMLG